MVAQQELTTSPSVLRVIVLAKAKPFTKNEQVTLVNARVLFRAPFAASAANFRQVKDYKRGAV